MKSFLFDIKRYAIHDGPGIRITLFFKGCPLSCVWCHNPEGISFRQEKLYNRAKCIGCGYCVEVCPAQVLTRTDKGIVTDPSACILCGECAAVCPSRAMELSGKEYSIDALMEEIEKETIFMDRSEGGVTFCGGEPLSHPSLLLPLLKRCGRQGIHRAVDTTLLASPEIVKEVMEHTDLFLVDLKMMDSARHRIYCGVPNERILSNLRMVSASGKAFIIRIPLIEGVNADRENIFQSAQFISSLPNPPRAVNLLPYHEIGRGKHERMGTIYNPQHIPMQAPTEERLRQCIALFNRFHIEITD